MTDLDRLSASEGGTWLITSANASRYLVDLDGRTLTRFRGAGEPGETAELRRDGEAVPLLRLTRCRVGVPMHVLIDVRGDGITSERVTSDVNSIELVRASEDPLPTGASEVATLDDMIVRARLGLVGLADRGMAIYGPHKALATPVLKALAARARNAGWSVIQVAPRPGAQAALLEDARRLGAQLGVTDEAPTGDVELDLEALLLDVAPALQREGVALMVAVDSLERTPRALIYALVRVQRFAATHHLPAFVFIAGGPGLPTILVGDTDLILDYRQIRGAGDPGPYVGT
jgi:hypothetical protein